MKGNKKISSPITILMIIIIFAAFATWVVPAGKYNTLAYNENKSFTINTLQGDTSLPFKQKTLDSLGIKISLQKFTEGAIHKPLSIPNTYHKVDKNGQNIIRILQAPLKGIYDSIDIILFLFVIGAFMYIFNESGAMVSGLTALAQKMKGKETWLIIILTFLFSFAGASYGMAEEALVFYPILVPLFLAAGYDLLVPVAVIFAGTQLGTLSSFTNPFSTIIASNAAGVNWADGLYMRIFMFFVSTIISIVYIVKYAIKVKNNPAESLVFKIDGNVASPYPVIMDNNTPENLTTKTKLLLLLFLATFLIMIAGVVWFNWWLLEMTSLFLASTILLGFILKIKESTFVAQFVKGAESLLGVALIVGVARGVTLILNEGHISDSILFYSAKLVGNMPPALFIVVMLGLFIFFTLFISSSSGMAVLTMPIMGALAMMVHVPGREIVNAYLFGMGIMGFITPTGLILPSLALVNVSIKTWLKFITPLLIILFILCALFLIIGVYK